MHPSAGFVSRASVLVAVIVPLWSVLGFPTSARAVDCDVELEVLREPVLLPGIAPQDIAFDPATGTYWVTSGVGPRIFVLDRELASSGTIELEILAGGRPVIDEPLSGIAWDPAHETLWVARRLVPEIWEIAPDGAPTGRILRPELSVPGNPNQRPTIHGIAFSAEGDGGRGSIWLVNGAVTDVQEIDLEGATLRRFCVPFDRDGCPGKGQAAFSFGVDLVRGANGELALDLLADCGGSSCIVGVDLDGSLTGRRIPLATLGARPAGFVHVAHPHDASRQALAIITDSDAKARIVGLERDPPSPPFSLEGTVVEDGAVTLSWGNGSDYDAIEIFREEELIATLSGDAETYTDPSPPMGAIEYDVVGALETCATRAKTTVVVGPGRVLARADLRELLGDGSVPVDLTQDDEGFVWVTVRSPRPRIVLLSPELELLFEVPPPFSAADEASLGAIAFRPDTRTILVYDNARHRIAEIDLVGDPVGEPFSSGIVDGDEDPVSVVAMAYRTGGDEGRGSIIYLIGSHARIEERALDGRLIASCLHPHVFADPPALRAGLGPYLGGIGLRRGGGDGAGGESELDSALVAGGLVREAGVTRILPMSLRDCARSPVEITLRDLDPDLERRPPFVTFHPGRSGAREVIFVLAFHSQRPSLIAIEDGLPDVAPPVEVSVAQTTSEPDARIEFRPGPNVDATEILRDDTLIATLAPQVTAFIDRGVAPGKRRYRLRSVRGERRSEERVVSLQVGPGSIADRELTHPVSLVAAVASRPGLTPDLDEWIVSSTSFAHGDELHVFDRDLRRTRAIPSPFARPLRPALLTVRTNASGDEIFVLGWASGAASDMTELPVEVIDPEGRRLRRFAFRPPPPRGHSVAFPTGLAYREASDTLFYYDRNSAMLTELDPSGFILRTFEQPVAPFDHRVVALGLGVHPLTGSLWVASAGRGEERASRIVELALGGKATGAEIHLDLAVGQDPRGFAFDRDGASFVVPSVTSGLGELIRYRAFDLVSPVADLSCAIEGVVGEGTLRARLIWRNIGAYEAVEVYRGTELAVVLEGDAEQWVDLDPPGCGGFWRVVPVRDGARAAGSICDRPALRPFVRGDVEENGSINISDAVRILEHLFLGGNEPACLDAADVDDDGAVNITDPIRLLGFLFLASGAPPPPPFPTAGCDPTDDALGCNPVR